MGFSISSSVLNYICHLFLHALKRWPVMSSVDQSIWPPPGIRQRRIPLLFYTSKRHPLCLATKGAKWHQRKLLRNYLWIFPPRVGQRPTLRPRGFTPGPAYSDRCKKKEQTFSSRLQSRRRLVFHTQCLWRADHGAKTLRVFATIATIQPDQTSSDPT